MYTRSPGSYLYNIALCVLLVPLPVKAVDNYLNMRETSNSPVGNCAYTWGWYEPDSGNYFVFTGLWHDTTVSYSGIAIVKATDPFNPVIVDTIRTPMAQDVKIIGSTLYAIDWVDVPTGLFLWIVSLKSQWPYYNAFSIDSIPFSDNVAIDTVGKCDTIPLLCPHTLFATDDYLFMTELRTEDAAGWEVAVFDIATNPTQPRLIKLWNGSDFDNRFEGPHSIFCLNNTVYIFCFWSGIYKGLIEASTPYDSITYQGKIWYDSFRNDLTDERQMDSIYCPEYEVTELKRPLSHSGWLSSDGNYIFACDEADNGCPSWGNYMGAFLRIFNENDFDFDSLSAPIANAFDIIWDFPTEQDLFYYGIDDIAAVDTFTHCPEPMAPCFTNQSDADQFGIHDPIVRGNLLFCSWYDRGTRVFDISGLTNIQQYAYADHNCGPSDSWTSEAYSEYPLSPDGYIYQGGVDGLYIYQLGVTGALASSATWYGDNYLYDTLTVSSGQTLTLAAGSHIYLYKNAMLKINGTLVANGTSSDSVKFICLGGNPQPGDWRGIYVEQNAACSLSYCSITNAIYGIENRNNSVVTVSNSNISNNSVAGLYCYKGFLDVNGSAVCGNSIYGIYGQDADVDVDYSRLIDNCSGGIRLAGKTTLSHQTSITYDTLALASISSASPAIYLASIDTGRVFKCRTRDYQTGLYLSQSDLEVSNDDFSASNTYGIYADNYSYPTIRQCRIDTLSIGVRTSQSNPDLGTSGSHGNCSFINCDNYYIYHVYLPPTPETLFAQYNYYGGPPDTTKFSAMLRNSYIYWNPALRSAPPAPRLDPEQPQRIPLVFELRQNYPNPFNPTTTIAFSLDEPNQTFITIYNLLGQRVTTLTNEYRLAGEHAVIWNGRDEKGNEVSSGVYFYLIQSGQHVQAKKMTLLR